MTNANACSAASALDTAVTTAPVVTAIWGHHRTGATAIRGSRAQTGSAKDQNRSELGDYALNAIKAAIARLEGITVLSDDVAKLATFYRDALGLRVDVAEQNYVAFGGEGIRFAVFSRIGMSPNTHDHPDYRRQFTGQAFELNFECTSPDDVIERFNHIVANGGRSIADPTKKPWGHFAGFFADPEGNIHSLFAVLAE